MLRWSAKPIHEGPGPGEGWRELLVYLPAVGLVVTTLLFATPLIPAPPQPGEAATSAQRTGLRTIVLDPGHGGQAAGAVGPGGLSEKDITLDVAVQLRELIYRRLGLQVILTREADIDVPHVQRTEKANYWRADLFLSIHVNSYKLGGVRGPETYFLSATASDNLAGSAAASENQGAVSDPQAGPGRDGESLEFILWDLAQTQHLRESSLLAEIIQSNMNDVWQVRDRGVKQAPFIVLRGATMPAVLVEVGYLSNDEDAARLADASFRRQIAEALYRSITAFRERYAVMVGAPPEP